MAGIVYNGLRPLDLAHDKSDRTKIRGSVKTLTTIPYDYKDKNPGLFVDTGVQSTAELYSQDGSGNTWLARHHGTDMQKTSNPSDPPPPKKRRKKTKTTFLMYLIL